MLDGGSTFSMGWTPESGFLSARWDTYAEMLMLYLLAIGATVNPIPASAWQAFARPTLTYQGLTYITNLSSPCSSTSTPTPGSTFATSRTSTPTTSTTRSLLRKPTSCSVCHLPVTFSDYSDNLWGITASDSVNGYVVWGGPPAMGPIDGSIVPCAAAAPFRFCPPTALRCCATSRAHSQIRGRGTASWMRSIPFPAGMTGCDRDRWGILCSWRRTSVRLRMEHVHENLKPGPQSRLSGSIRED